MKKIYLFLYLLLLSAGANAQTASAYGFTAFTSPYNSISSTGTSTTALGLDEATLTGIPIGFTFTFCGINYTTLSACSNGWLSLANTPSVEYNNYAVLIPSAGFLMPYWDDLSGQVTFSSPAIPAYYSTTGSAPNRVFTFEWKNWSPYIYPGSTGTGLGSFQVKLYETTNIIDFCYGPSTFAGMGATIGIANSTTDWQTLPNVSASPTPSSSTFTNTLAVSPAPNQVYRWAICTPPPITGITTVCVGGTSTLSDPTTGGTWASASPGIATIGLTSGVLTGVSAGTAVISYTSTPGCVRTTVVTVNPTPPSILGTLTVCAGSNTTLSNIIPGGTWTSGTTSVATIGASTGLVSAISAGTSVITYTTGTGCSTTAIVTVNALPAAIAGTLSLCVGSVSSLADVTPGGSWISGNPGVATVGSGTGVATGVGAGTSVISYIMPSGCSSTAIVTVSAAPSAIGGPSSVCVGSTITLTNSVAGGTWTTGAPATAIVAPTTGIVSGISSGTATITYTVGSSCTTTKVITVNPATAAITGTLTVCQGLTTTLADATAGGTWSSAATSIATVDAASGVVTGIAAGTANISYTSSLGCVATAIVTVNPSPAPISGTAVICESSTSTLSNSTVGGLWTSSLPVIADVGILSGIVTAFSAGTATISYTLGTGCYAVKIVTVNPSPDGIAGSLGVCLGLTTTLSTATTGGAWSSSAPGTASVGATTGIVTGLALGTAAISYVLPVTGCYRRVVITVNPLPADITGTASVCPGLTTTLADASPGGGWSSGATGVATVDGSGVVTGVTPGTAIITYTLPTFCSKTIVVTVNPLPAAITGTATVCQGQTTTLADPTAGGTWISGATGIATIGASTGIATGVAGGTATISYVLPTGCLSTRVLTVNPTPAITGTASVCEGSTTTLSNTLSGTWASGNLLIATVGPSSGVVSGLVAGTAVITFTFTTGCVTTTVVTVNPLPAAITGTASVCVGLTTTLADATPGGTWLSGSTGNATIGAGTGIVTGVAAGTSNITYTVTITGCRATTVVTVTPLPSTITGPTQVCAGSVVTLSDATAGGTWGSSNASVATANATTGEITGVAAGTATITYTGPNGCYITTTMTVNPIPPAIGGPSTVCIGATSTLTDAAFGGTWISSNTGNATIGLSSGIVTGVATGTTTITYTAPTGCVITRIITVNPLPAAITGSIAFCQASTITLSDASPSGNWSSSNTSVATVGASSGIVTGIAGGTATITYTIPTGCFTTTIVTVNPLPAAIGGNASVCLGLTSTLTNTSGGGTWASSNTSIATVGLSNGVVSGIATGTATITYTLVTGCLRTIMVTVNPLPVAITGTMQVCVNATTSLDDASTGGLWTSGNTGVATVTLATGVVTGVSAATARITYTLPTTCFATAVVTVNPLPAAISGPIGVCLGATATLSDVTPSGTWSSSDPATATIGTSTGIVSGLALGTATITYKLTTTGCEITRTQTVNPLPDAITGPATVCGGGGVITLSDATTGGTWTSSNTGIATVGASTGIVTGVVNGLATITYTLGTGCFTTFGVSVNPIPPAIIIPLGDTTVCPGGFVALTASTGVGYSYQWYRAGAPIPGAASATYITGVSGSYSVKVFNALGCPATSTPMQVTIDTAIAVITAPGGTLTGCAGGSIVLNANPGTGLSYQWLLGGTPIPGATSTTYTALTSGIYAVTVTNGTGCSATDDVSVILNPVPVTTLTISGPLTFCQGGSVTLYVPASAGTTWQWSNAFGPITGATSNTYTASVAGSYSVLATNSSGCTAGSAVTMVVVNPLPSVDIMPGGPMIFCTGGNVALNATGGVGYDYQWYKDGIAISGATNATFIASIGGGYRVRVTNSTSGCSDITHADSVVTVVGTAAITPFTPAVFCWGGSALLGTNVPAMSGVTYQWSKDGVAIAGATSPHYNATIPGSYTCSISIPSSCTAVTAAVPVTERPLPNPVISYNTSTHVLSTQAYYTSYQWYKDLGMIPGATAATTIATGNGAYKVQVTDTNGCQSFSTSFPLTTYTGSGLAVNNINIGEVRIYPNPAKNSVHIEAATPVRVIITALDGRTVAEHAEAATHEINISALANGVYMVSVFDESGVTLKVEKLVKTSE